MVIKRSASADSLSASDCECECVDTSTQTYDPLTTTRGNQTREELQPMSTHTRTMSTNTEAVPTVSDGSCNTELATLIDWIFTSEEGTHLSIIKRNKGIHHTTPHKVKQLTCRNVTQNM